MKVEAEPVYPYYGESQREFERWHYSRFGFCQETDIRKWRRNTLKNILNLPFLNCQDREIETYNRIPFFDKSFSVEQFPPRMTVTHTN